MKKFPDMSKISHSSFLDENGCVVYKIIRKPIRNAYLHYDTKDNIFYVTCSKWFSVKQIDEFVKQNYRKLISKYQQKEKLQDYQLFGNKITIQFIPSKLFKVELREQLMIVYSRNENHGKTLIKNYVYEIANSYLTNRTQELLNKIHLNVKNIKVKWFNNRWGSYSRPNDELVLSAQLVKFDKEVIDAVIWHEIAHITHYNHSPKFHKLLEQYCPNHKQLEKKLNHYFDF